MEAITLRQITSQDISYFGVALDLLNRTQGIGLFPQNYLEQRTSDIDSFVVGAFEDKNLVGIGVAQLISSFDFYLPFDSSITNELKDKVVGSFSTLAIREDLQGKGIGQKISLERLSWLKAKNCSVILGVSWVSGLAHTSDRVFEKMGFKPIKKIEQFFRDLSLQKPFDCPGCKKVPCECDGILYRLDLKNVGLSY